MNRQFERALKAYFSTNANRETGRLHKYGIRVLDVQNAGANVKVEFRFSANREYCCFEFGCHCGLLQQRGWERLRKLLASEKLDPAPMTIRFSVIVEPGAQASILRQLTGCAESDGYTYTTTYSESG